MTSYAEKPKAQVRVFLAPGPLLAKKANAAMREFIIDLSSAESFEDFVAAFNEGLCKHVGGGWEGRNWNAFHDYLSWPEEQSYRLTFRGWEGCTALDPEDRDMIREILSDNPHVQAAFA